MSAHIAIFIGGPYDGQSMARPWQGQNFIEVVDWSTMAPLTPSGMKEGEKIEEKTVEKVVYVQRLEFPPARIGGQDVWIYAPEPMSTETVLCRLMANYRPMSVE